MTTKELSELIEEARVLLINDFKLSNKHEPTKKELLNHIKYLYKENQEDTIISSLFLEDIDHPTDFHKLLLVSSVLLS